MSSNLSPETQDANNEANIEANTSSLVPAAAAAAVAAIQSSYSLQSQDTSAPSASSVPASSAPVPLPPVLPQFLHPPLLFSYFSQSPHLPPSVVIAFPAPGSHLRRQRDQQGRWQKEVNVPRNAHVETINTRNGSSWHRFTTTGTGPLRFAGNSCTASNCVCGHVPWVTAGELRLEECVVMCEVCGMMRNDFLINRSNLRKHVHDYHVIKAGKQRDVEAGRLYSAVVLQNRAGRAPAIPPAAFGSSSSSVAASVPALP